MTKVLTPQTLRCPVTGKSAYASESRARRIIERSQTAEDWRDEHGAPAREAYVCQHCAWWHLTKKGKRRDEAQVSPAAA